MIDFEDIELGQMYYDDTHSIVTFFYKKQNDMLFYISTEHKIKQTNTSTRAYDGVIDETSWRSIDISTGKKIYLWSYVLPVNFSNYSKIFIKYIYGEFANGI